LNKYNLTKNIKEISKELGFDLVGISKPEIHREPSLLLEKWLDNNMHATMHWIEKRKEERKNIFKYFPNVKSIISFGHNYYSDNSNNDSYKISNYSWGDDYHIVLKKKLFKIIEFIKTNYNSDFEYRVCVDTSPIMEKFWGQNSGLGWIGKHTNLINKNIGSWFFLSEILLDLDLDFDSSFKEDLCGTCTKCIDLCPTGALSSYSLDSNKCISYLTIENRDDIPKEYSDNLNDWMYGCDICQEICPWNIKNEIITSEKSFHIRDELQSMTKKDWEALTKEKYNKIFKKSSIKRAKYENLIRNILANKASSNKN